MKISEVKVGDYIASNSDVTTAGKNRVIFYSNKRYTISHIEKYTNELYIITVYSEIGLYSEIFNSDSIPTEDYTFSTIRDERMEKIKSFI